MSTVGVVHYQIVIYFFVMEVYKIHELPSLRQRILRSLILKILPSPDESWRYFPEADIAEYTGQPADDPDRIERLRQTIAELRANQPT